MTKRALVLVAAAAAVVAPINVALVLQLRDAEHARRDLADWKQSHRCPPPFEKDPPASLFAWLVHPAPMRDPALDPVDAALDDQPEEVRRG